MSADDKRARFLEAAVLGEARDSVYGARYDTYGHPRDNHTRTAALWSTYLGVPVTPRQVCMLNVLQKISRDAYEAKRDNLVDIAGYVENAAMIVEMDDRDLTPVDKP